MTEKLWHVDFGEKLYKVLIKISEMLGGHRSPGVVPPPIYTKQPRFCSLPTLYRTPIECNIRYAFSLLITVHSNIEMKEQSSQLGYSWHVLWYACLSVCLSVCLCCRPPTTASGSSEERRPAGAGGPAAAAAGDAGTEGTAGDAWTTSVGSWFRCPVFFSPPKRGTKRLQCSVIFFVWIYKLSCEHLFFWKGSWKMTQKPELDVLTFF